MKVAAVIVACLAFAAPARAAVVQVDVTRDEEREDVATAVLEYVGDRADNDVSIRWDNGAFRVLDRNARLRAGAHCHSATAHEAVCQFGAPNDIDHIDAEFGAGDDGLVARDVPASITAGGGAGNDRISASGSLFGGTGDDVLQGGRWADDLYGGPGRDRVSGGARRDRFIDEDRADADVYSGGPGRDEIVYDEHPGHVTARLDGSRGGEDHISGIEDVRGGPGDRLVGSAARNRFTVIGGRVSAGDGTDRIVTLSGGHFDCGTGADTVLVQGGSPLLEPDCERVGNDLLYVPAQGNTSALEVICAPDTTAVTLRARGGTVARGTAPPHQGYGPCTVPMRSTRSATRRSVVSVVGAQFSWRFRLRD